MAGLIRSYRELEVYTLAHEAQQRIFQTTKKWPAEERYALTDQVRRSSRSVGANIAEAWAKRRYPAHFLSKLTDADGELQETFHWLDTAQGCGYLSVPEHTKLMAEMASVGRMLGRMMEKYQSFCVRQ